MKKQMSYKAKRSMIILAVIVILAIIASIGTYTFISGNDETQAMSQTNGNEKQTDFADESCIAGSKAMRNKVDAGFVMLPLKERPKDRKLIEPFIKIKGRIKPESYPNRITYLYKARFGEYSDQKIKVYHHFDAATMRNKDFFCCDAGTNKLNIPFPKL